MNKGKPSFPYQEAKEIVHDALKQHPNAIPWFIGIYDDWTIGYLKTLPGGNNITFYSENFSDQAFCDICCFISERIEKELLLKFIIHYANFNNEPGRLVVKQLIEAVTDLIRDKPVKCEKSYGSHSFKKPESFIDGIPEALWYMKHGSFDVVTDDEDDQQ